MPRRSAATPAAAVVRESGDRLLLEGALDLRTLPAAHESLRREIEARHARTVDLGGLASLDTPGALFLRALADSGIELTGIRSEHRSLLDLVRRLETAPLPERAALPRWRQLLIELGRGGEFAVRDAFDVIAFLGRATSALGRTLVHPRTLRLPSLSRQVAETGIAALPIIALMAVMISVVIGYQGVAQLRPYGGEDFTVNLVAVSVLREMGVLITAIMVAGRSGSAFTAEIGVMKAREEVDALEVMGLDPLELLVVPRLLGLVLTLPLLAFFSDVMGLAGGALIAHSELGLSPAQYLERVRHAVDGSDLFVGIVKAPVFAFVIAVVGCMHGLRVGGSAESVGRETTRAVVKSIFLVIVLDALFSVLFDKLRL
jgi:phospholipid/cholesterol/gamma-HCH transport system permease protein